VFEDMTICVGTVGGGVHVSPDGGGNWTQVFKPVPPEGNVRALRVCPHDPARIWAGSDIGLFRSDDRGERWKYVAAPLEGRQVWSIAVDPTDPEVVYVGTRPGILRTRDGGASWDELPISIVEECLAGVPRTTNVVVDPRRTGTVWAGVEIDGVFRSTDGGDTWEKTADLGPSSLSGDIHGLAVRSANGGGPDDGVRVFATTPFGVSTSDDEGATWDLHQFPGFYEGNKRAYCRCVMFKADDPDTMFVGTGDTIPGETGALQISRDGGASWSPAELPERPYSVVYWLATHPERPDAVAAASLYGQLYLSEDAGRSWSRAARTFGEIRALAVTPR
jgi:photosystem II stability/assembly factor-like uncharacterized protein